MEKRYKLGNVAKGKYYGAIGQSRGSILWWVISCNLYTHVSNGLAFHYHIVKGANIHKIFRGRATKSIGGTLTILPPVEFYSNKENWANIPDYILIPLVRRFTPKEILVDMGDRAGMRILHIIESK